MAGIGKTWLAHKYLQQESGDFCKVLLNCSSLETLNRDVRWALGLMGSPVSTQTSDRDARRILRSRLEDQCIKKAGCQGWILVLDDTRHDTEQESFRLMPTRGENGRVLITTRSKQIAKDFGGPGDLCYELELPDLEWASEMFSHLSGIKLHSDSKQRIQEIIKSVGRLPLAVGIAAARAKDKTLNEVHKEKDDVSEFSIHNLTRVKTEAETRSGAQLGNHNSNIRRPSSFW
jgi:hypothetical protein